MVTWRVLSWHCIFVWGDGELYIDPVSPPSGALSLYKRCIAWRTK